MLRYLMRPLRRFQGRSEVTSPVEGEADLAYVPGSAPGAAATAVVAAEVHGLTADNISNPALLVLEKLQAQGFQAYLVGGCVRDLLLGGAPKDFDVATDARPQQVKRTFKRCLLIGRRFRLAHVRFGRETIEVATFRGETAELQATAGTIQVDNVYGSIAEDVQRRDLTINALYYNPHDGSLIDYLGGLADLKAGLVRVIGDPEQRYREDPVRMLRVLRFAAKWTFQIAPETKAPLAREAALLQQVPPARLQTEVMRLFYQGFALRVFLLLREYGLFSVLFPQTEASFTQGESCRVYALVEHACVLADQRYHAGQSLSLPYLFAVLLWHPLQAALAKRRRPKNAKGRMVPLTDAVLEATAEDIIAQQNKRVAISRRQIEFMLDVWGLQRRLVNASVDEMAELQRHRRFRPAYDFLLLRARAGDAVWPAAAAWSLFTAGETTHPLFKQVQKVERERPRQGQARGDRCN